MKIAVDVRPLLGSEPSGVGEYTLNLLKEIFKQDQANQYVLFYNVYKIGYDKLILKNFANKYKNVSIVASHWPNKILDFCLKFINYPKLDKFVGGVDLFWAPNLHYLSVSKDCRLALTVHDVSFKVFPEFFSWRKRLWHSFLGANPVQVFKRADILFAVSANTKKDLVNFYQLSAEKIKVTPLAVDQDFLDFQKNILENNLAENLVDVK